MIENKITLDCNVLESVQDGAETKWGCSAASTENKCLEDWWNQCCSWNGVVCTSKHQGNNCKVVLKLEILFLTQ